MHYYLLLYLQILCQNRSFVILSVPMGLPQLYGYRQIPWNVIPIAKIQQKLNIQ